MPTEVGTSSTMAIEGFHHVCTCTSCEHDRWSGQCKYEVELKEYKKKVKMYLERIGFVLNAVEEIQPADRVWSMSFVRTLQSTIERAEEEAKVLGLVDP
jgi:hypothetical protein